MHRFESRVARQFSTTRWAPRASARARAQAPWQSVQFSTRRRFSWGRSVSLGVLAVAGSFGAFVSYKVLWCHKHVQLPYWVHFRDQTITDAAELARVSWLNTTLLENLIDYYLLDALSLNAYIQDHYKLPLSLETFQFARSKFTAKVRAKHTQLSILRLSPNPNTRYGISGTTITKIVSSSKLVPFRPKEKGAIIASKPEIKDTVKVFQESSASALAKENDVEVWGEVQINNTDAKVRFCAVFNEEHSHIVRISRCSVVDTGHEVVLWGSK